MASVLSTAGVNSRKFVISQSDAGRELIVKVALTDMTNDNLNDIYNAITSAGGSGSGDDINGPDAFTVAGFGTAAGTAFVSGTTDVVFFRVQGTGTFNTTTAAAGTGATVTVEAIFTPAL